MDNVFSGVHANLLSLFVAPSQFVPCGHSIVVLQEKAATRMSTRPAALQEAKRLKMTDSFSCSVSLLMCALEPSELFF